MEDPELERLAEKLQHWHPVDAPPMGPAEARAAAAAMLAGMRRTDAQRLAGGCHILTIVHGDLETQDDVDALHELHRWVDRHPGAVEATRGTNDTTTFVLGGPDAAGHADALLAVAQEFSSGWRITRQGGNR